MELSQYIRLIRKWWWLVLIAAGIAGGASFLSVRTRVPQYEAQATLIIGSGFSQRNLQRTDFSAALELAETYVRFVRTSPVLQGTLDALGLPYDIDRLRGMVGASSVLDTPLVVIKVIGADPEEITAIANEIANQVILLSPTGLTPDDQERLEFYQEQVRILNEELLNTRGQLNVIDAELASATDPVQIARLQQQRNAVVDQVNQTVNNIASFSATISGMTSGANVVEVFEPARVPTSAGGSSTITTTLLGVIVGGVLGIGLVVLLEYLNDTLKSTEEIAKLLRVPVLGGVMRFNPRDLASPEMLALEPGKAGRVVENFRTIRTNLLFSSSGEEKDIYIVTSSLPEEGKTTTASNVAVSMAVAGYKVLLVDADLRRPQLHNLFKLHNDVGVTTLLSKFPANSAPGENGLPQAFWEVTQGTMVNNLRVITSGPLPPNPTELLGSEQIQLWMDVLRESPVFDIIIFDTPPSLLMADASVLAATISASAIIVVNAGRTRRGAARTIKEQLAVLNVPIKGVIVNRLNPQNERREYRMAYDRYMPRSGEAPAARKRTTAEVSMVAPPEKGSKK